MSSFNLPNSLTVLRILASFVFLYYALTHQWKIAFPIFCAAAFTDMVDGTLARVLRQRTRLGGFLDPTADKLLMFFGFLTLTLNRFIPWSLTAIIIARDLFITVGLAILKFKKVTIIYRPTYLSKLTTFLQIVTVFSAMLATQELSRFRESVYGNIFLQGMPFILWITGVLTVVTGLQYLRIGRRMLQSAPDSEKIKTHPE